MTDLQARLTEVKVRIIDAAQSAGRLPDTVRLIVVTKGHSPGIIEELYDHGAREIGESYIDEAREKQATLVKLSGMRWHMIGHVQSRKAKEAAQHFNMIHSVDSVKLAQRLDRFASETNRKLPILLECNVSGESTKNGWRAWDEGKWDGLLPDIGETMHLPNVEIHGLMSMAPYSEDPVKARPFFAKTRKLRDFLKFNLPQIDWRELSMGMSGDFEGAIKEGATIVRIGTAILGERPKKGR